MSVTTEHGTASPDTIAAKVADCRATERAGMTAAFPNPTRNESYGSSTDRTLEWYSAVEPNGKREFVLRMWNGNSDEMVLGLSSTVP
jgi:hypothetical protein